jgi:hypothetical protein
VNEDKYHIRVTQRSGRGGSRQKQTHEVEANSEREAHAKLPGAPHHRTVHWTINASTPAGRARIEREKHATYSTDKNPKYEPQKPNYVLSTKDRHEIQHKRKAAGEKFTFKEDCSPLEKKIELKAFPKTAALLQKMRDKECEDKKVKKESVNEVTARGIDRIQRAQHSHAVSMGLAHKLTAALRTFKNDVVRIQASGDSSRMKAMKIARLNKRINSLKKKNTGRDAVVGRQFARIKE